MSMGKRRGAAFIALYALLLEIFFGAMHAAALAASAFGPPTDPSSFIFQICTPDGIAEMPADVRSRDDGSSPRQQSPRQSASDFCPVCGAAATSPFTAATPVTVPPGHRPVDDFTVETRQARSLTAWRANRARAPPV